ncbi:MAG TPA: hypothetical protein VGG84_00820 [Gemmatimonadaceae bacterium]
MQIQDGATAKLVGYQMDHGHHGAIAELPENGIVESPRSALDQLTAGSLPEGTMTSATAIVDGDELKAKVVEAPGQPKPAGAKGAQTE